VSELSCLGGHEVAANCAGLGKIQQGSAVEVCWLLPWLGRVFGSALLINRGTLLLMCSPGYGETCLLSWLGSENLRVAFLVRERLCCCSPVRERLVVPLRVRERLFCSPCKGETCLFSGLGGRLVILRVKERLSCSPGKGET
jgi:hypothetical protein